MASWAVKSVLVLAGLSVSAAVTPVEKVITLLEDLKTQVETEGAAEATTYDEFACFCKDTSTSKSTAIKDGQDSIDLGAATIAEKTAEKAATVTELNNRQVKQEQLKADLEATTVRCAAEKAAYEVKDADLVKSIGGLKGAIKAMSDSKPTSFLATRQTIQHSLDFVNTLGHPQQKLAAVFQQLARVDPADPEYAYHSQGILDTVGQLLKEFEAEKAAADDEETKRKDACDATKATLNEEISDNAKAMEGCEKLIQTLAGEIADTREGLVNSEAMLKDDQTYLKDLTERCEARAKDWDQRTQQRADELTALSQALTILSDRVSIADTSVNERAMLAQIKPVVAVAAPAKASFAFVQIAEVVKGQSVAEMKVSRVIDMLRSESSRLHSTILSSAAANLPRFNNDAKYDPFVKVKELIQSLVERLLKEATEEATKKGFCDEELGKAEQDRDYRLEDVQTLSAELASLEAKEDELTLEISDLTTGIANLREALNSSTEMRAEEKAENLKTIVESNEGLEAVKEALTILRTFYKQAAKAPQYLAGELNKVSMVQASPVDEDTTGPGFNGAYSGNQEKSSGVIGLLEVIQSDFERTTKTTAASEKKAQADFVDFDRVSKTDISGKETKKELDEEDLATTRNKIETATADMKTNMDLLDSALKALEELAPMCIDMTMPYEERVAKREEEIAALHKALCILDTDGVEADCSGGGGMPQKF